MFFVVVPELVDEMQQWKAANWATRGLAMQLRERMEAKQQLKPKLVGKSSEDYWAFGLLPPPPLRFSPVVISFFFPKLDEGSNRIKKRREDPSKLSLPRKARQRRKSISSDGGSEISDDDDDNYSRTSSRNSRTSSRNSRSSSRNSRASSRAASETHLNLIPSEPYMNPLVKGKIHGSHSLDSITVETKEKRVEFADQVDARRRKSVPANVYPQVSGSTATKTRTEEETVARAPHKEANEIGRGKGSNEMLATPDVEFDFDDTEAVKKKKKKKKSSRTEGDEGGGEIRRSKSDKDKSKAEDSESPAKPKRSKSEKREKKERGEKRSKSADGSKKKKRTGAENASLPEKVHADIRAQSGASSGQSDPPSPHSPSSPSVRTGRMVPPGKQILRPRPRRHSDLVISVELPDIKEENEKSATMEREEKGEPGKPEVKRRRSSISEAVRTLIFLLSSPFFGDRGSHFLFPFISSFDPSRTLSSVGRLSVFLFVKLSYFNINFQIIYLNECSKRHQPTYTSSEIVGKKRGKGQKWGKERGEIIASGL